MLYRVLVGLLSVSALMLNLKAQTNSDSLKYQRYLFENGAVSSEGYLLRGQPEGYWRSYYRDGTLKSEGNRKNFRLDSTWRFYDKSGGLKAEINYRNDTRQGLTKIYQDGILVKTEPYQDGKIDGRVQELYANGKLQKEIPYEVGQRVGIGFTYAEDGRRVGLQLYESGRLVRSQSINQIDDYGRKQGLWMDFHPNLQVKFEGPYVNDLKNGYWKYYRANGNLLRVEKWIMGVLQEGSAETAKVAIKRKLDPKTGKLQYKGSYRNGKPVGLHREYGPDGSVVASKIYENGVLLSEGIVDEQGRRQGPWKFFYPDRQLKAEGSYRDDRKIGNWRYYFDNGGLEQTGNYLRGLPDGEWNWYYPSGNILRTENYIMGEEDGASVEYSDSGAVIAQGTYVGGKKEGYWFFELNDHREEGSFFEGERSGVWRHYYLDNGRIRFEGYYENGIKNGQFVWYYSSGQIKRRGRYLNNKRDGLWEFFDEQGNRILTVAYEEGEEKSFNGKNVDFKNNSRAFNIFAP